jgi:type I restriction enzyme S subunit
MKPGYKQTEVGVIPEEWEARVLPEICWFQEGPGLRQWQFTTSGMKVINVTNLENGFLNLDRTDRHISLLEFVKMYKHFAIDAGDIVMASSGNSYSKTAIVREQDLPLVMNTSVIRFKPSKAVEYDFLWSFLNSWIFKDQIDLMITGGAQPNFGPYHLKRVFAPTPSLPEQRAIAGALSDVDDLIRALDRLIAKKRDIKQAAMQQFLTGKKRLPGFRKRLGYKQTSLGPVPEDWSLKPLKVVSTMNGRIGWQGLKQEEFTQKDDDPFLITGMNFKDGEIRWDEVYHIPEKRYEEAKPIQLRDGDILMTKDGTIGKMLYVENIPFPGKASLNSHLLVFRPINESYVPKFLFYQLSSKRFADYIDLNKSGTTFFGITQQAVGNYPTYLPRIEEQTAIANVLSNMDAEITALEQKRDKTRLLKQGMMQELLTGRVRLVSRASGDVRQERTTDTDKPHSWQFNEAVVISVLTKDFGSESYPLGRKRYTKLSYLLHRHAEQVAEDYMKKAAGPYNPKTKYGGPEKIALKNGYVREHQRGKYSGFVANEDNIDQAEAYFEKWYGNEPREWLGQFRYEKNDELELLTTVDMAMVELRGTGVDVYLESVKDVMHDHPEWKAKLKRPIFSDPNISRAIQTCGVLFEETE